MAARPRARRPPPNVTSGRPRQPRHVTLARNAPTIEAAAVAGGLLAAYGGLFLLAFADLGPLRLDGVALGVLLIALGRDRRGDLARLLAGELDDVVVLEQVTDDGGGGGLTSDGRGEHDARHREAVTFDDAGQHLAQLFARRVVGVLAELLDAIRQRRIGEHEGDAFHRTVEPALRCRIAERCRRRLAAHDAFEGLTVVFVEGRLPWPPTRRPKSPGSSGRAARAPAAGFSSDSRSGNAICRSAAASAGCHTR